MHSSCVQHHDGIWHMDRHRIQQARYGKAEHGLKHRARGGRAVQGKRKKGCEREARIGGQREGSCCWGRFWGILVEDVGLELPDLCTKLCSRHILAVVHRFCRLRDGVRGVPPRNRGASWHCARRRSSPHHRRGIPVDHQQLSGSVRSHVRQV